MTLPGDAASTDVPDKALLDKLLSLKGEIGDFVEDVEDETRKAEKEGRNLNLDTRPLSYLRRTASRITDELPPQHELFRIFHAGDALKNYAKAVEAEWPDFLAGRYLAICNNIALAADKSEDWRAIKREHLDAKQAAEVPKVSSGLADLLEQEPEIVDPAIAAALKSATDDLERALDAAGRTDTLDAATDALAIDLLNGTENVLQKIAEAGLWLYNSRMGREVRKAPGYIADGFCEQFPKETKRLGGLLAKLSVWGPVAAGGGALAGKFGWLAPIVRLFSKDAPQISPAPPAKDDKPRVKEAREEAADGSGTGKVKPKAAPRKPNAEKPPAGRGRAGRGRTGRPAKPE
ncbi:MAG: hypothetical protein JNM89_00580 [Hyphomicrobiaceae bacterium]|nr:hypothetical protein [Hyphomicrobiaceae bacterium]